MRKEIDDLCNEREYRLRCMKSLVAQLEEEYEELLNETCETIKIGSLEYDPGYVLKNIDPIAFRCGVSDMLADDEQYIEVDGQYYNVCDIENMVEELS